MCTRALFLVDSRWEETVITCSEACVPDFSDPVSGKIRQKVVENGYTE